MYKLNIIKCTIGRLQDDSAKQKGVNIFSVKINTFMITLKMTNIYGVLTVSVYKSSPGSFWEFSGAVTLGSPAVEAR